MKNKIILGTVQLGLDYGINNKSGKPSVNQAFDILNTAFDNDIFILDTAEAYGNSQEVIGLFHKKYPTKKFKIISKINPADLDRTTNIKQKVLANLKILNTNTLYAYMFHQYQGLKNNNKIYLDLIKLKKEGLIKKIGISLYSNKELEDVINNYENFDIVQLPFNVLDNEKQRANILRKAHEKGIEIHTRSVFLQGLIFKNNEKLSGNLIDLKDELILLKNSIKKYNQDINTVALHYPLSKKYIDYILIGVETLEQLKANLLAINSSVSKNIFNEVDKINVKRTERLNPSTWKK